MDFNHLLFSLEGRIARKPYWVGILIIITSSIVLTLSLGPMFGVSVDSLMTEQRPIGTVKLDMLINLLVFWPGLAITVKRLHDRNRPATWGVVLYAVFFVAIAMEFLGMAGTPEAPALPYVITLLAMVGIGLWLLVELGFLRGTPGVNEYGPDPLAHFDQQGE